MKQSSLDLNLSTKKTRKQELLAQMDLVVPWAALVELITPYYPEGKNGRPPFALETMLRIHCMQQWFTLSDLAMEEAFFDTPIYREFAQLDAHGRLGPKAKKDAASSAPTTRPVSRVGGLFPHVLGFEQARWDFGGRWLAFVGLCLPLLVWPYQLLQLHKGFD